MSDKKKQNKVSIYIDSQLLKDFKIKCINKDLKYQEQIRKLIKEYVNSP